MFRCRHCPARIMTWSTASTWSAWHSSSASHPWNRCRDPLDTTGATEGILESTWKISPPETALKDHLESFSYWILLGHDTFPIFSSTLTFQVGNSSRGFFVKLSVSFGFLCQELSLAGWSLGARAARSSVKSGGTSARWGKVEIWL